ncbi:MAG TPA: sigma-70 family RNA polymerase sigma factor [Candidatus Acidoferrales bacterium]|nr:sigma-70 family RNA polymerase sigma factor [Candidatus Acidoferrales bacterium]
MEDNNVDKLVDHLFRHESGKMVSVLTRTFGTENLEIVEDVVQDALLQATQLWPVNGIPNNPSAWLYQAARNKAIDVLRRNNHSVRLETEEESSLPDADSLLPGMIDEAGQEEIVKDDMLRMMFVCCHPAIPEENQITLILKVLCGFSTAEIARAFLTSEDTISKRLYRTKEFFRSHKIEFAVPLPNKLKSRIDGVLNSIYLLFNEGYNSTDSEELIRKDLMEEAILLCKMLTENPLTSQPETFALMALMCFQSSRNDSRLTPEGEIILLPDQDRSKWDFELIAAGNEFMNKAAYGDSVSKYHLEAAIAFEHCTAESFDRTNWARILELYEWLCRVSSSPVLELNKAVATMQVHGAAEALRLLVNIRDKKKIETYHIYHSLLGEIYCRLDRKGDAREEFEIAERLTGSETERRLMREKISAIARLEAAAG